MIIKWTVRALMIPFFPVYNALVFLWAVLWSLRDVPGYYGMECMTTAEFKAAWRSLDKPKEEYPDAD